MLLPFALAENLHHHLVASYHAVFPDLFPPRLLARLEEDPEDAYAISDHYHLDYLKDRRELRPELLANDTVTCPVWEFHVPLPSPQPGINQATGVRFENAKLVMHADGTVTHQHAPWLPPGQAQLFFTRWRLSPLPRQHGLRHATTEQVFEHTRPVDLADLNPSRPKRLEFLLRLLKDDAETKAHAA